MVMNAIMKEERPCALTDLAPGCRAKVAKVEGNCALRSRLSALGLTPDADIEVIDCACGRQLVKVRGCSLVLDGDTACHVTCALEAVADSGRESDRGRKHGQHKRWGLKH